MNTSGEKITETNRTLILKYTPDDLDNIASLIADSDVMTYYPRTYTRLEAAEQLNKIIAEYEDDLPSFWKIIMKDTGEYAGQAGILFRNVGGTMEYMLGYMLHKKFWGAGLASEISAAILEYGYKILKLKNIITLIRPENLASVRVADKLNLKVIKQVDYYGFVHNYYVTS